MSGSTLSVTAAARPRYATFPPHFESNPILRVTWKCDCGHGFHSIGMGVQSGDKMIYGYHLLLLLGCRASDMGRAVILNVRPLSISPAHGD